MTRSTRGTYILVSFLLTELPRPVRSYFPSAGRSEPGLREPRRRPLRLLLGYRQGAVTDSGGHPLSRGHRGMRWVIAYISRSKGKGQSRPPLAMRPYYGGLGARCAV